VQEFPRATLIGATWVDGASVRMQVPAEAGPATAPKRRAKAK
jgi:hypothetical protein